MRNLCGPLTGEPVGRMMIVRVWPDGTTRLTYPKDEQTWVFELGGDATGNAGKILRKWLKKVPK